MLGEGKASHNVQAGREEGQPQCIEARLAPTCRQGGGEGER